METDYVATKASRIVSLDNTGMSESLPSTPYVGVCNRVVTEDKMKNQ